MDEYSSRLLCLKFLFFIFDALKIPLNIIHVNTFS